MPIEKRSESSYRLIMEDPANTSGERLPQLKKPVKPPEDVKKSSRKLEQWLELEMAKFRIEVESGQYVKPHNMTFAVFALGEWKANYARLKLGGNTRRSYYGTINAQLIPEFGHMKLGDIKTIHIVKFFAKLRTPEGRKDGRNKPLSTNTLINIYTVLKAVMDSAFKWRFVSVNPMDGVDRPTAGKKEKREMRQRKKAYTTEEARQVIAALCDEPEEWSLYFIGVILGGFRRGEMAAIQWQNVDKINKGLWIETQITFDEDGNTVEDEVKTVESAAFVPMPYWYMELLIGYYNKWAAERDLAVKAGLWEGEGKQYVFHSGRGLPRYPDAPTSKWGKLKKARGLPNVRLHDLRHTTAMLLREGGASLKDIQERLRHARIETTGNIYTHDSKVLSRAATDGLEMLRPDFLGTDWEQTSTIH